MPPLSETKLIERLKVIFETSKRSASLEVGMGDDAAVFSVKENERWVWTSDSFLESVHFERSWMSAQDLGMRAALASLSDLAAMGASPRFALCNLLIPHDESDAFLLEFLQGAQKAMDENGCAIIGGNCSRSHLLGVEWSVLGTLKGNQPILRTGALEKDALWITGVPGLSVFLTETMKRNQPLSCHDRKKWIPKSRFSWVEKYRTSIHAMIDVSDGLAADASKLIQNQPLDLILDRMKIPSNELLCKGVAQLGLDLLQLQLGPSDDYELVFAGAKDDPRLQEAEAKGEIFQIGSFRSGSQKTWLLDEQKNEKLLDCKGFDHRRP